MKTRSKKIIQITLAAGILLLLFGWMAGWFHSKMDSTSPLPEASEEELARTFTVTSVLLPVQYEALGTVHSRTEVTVAARIPGTIRSLLVEEGDRVTKGQTLILLDAPELSGATHAAEGQVEAARSALSQARRDFERDEELHERGMISRQQYERSKTNVEVAEANLAAARGGASQAGSMAGYTSITASTDGVVALKYLEEGDVVGPGTPILLIHDPYSLRLEAAVDETVGQHLERGEEAVAQIDAAGLTYPTRIEEILPQVDRATRTVIVKTPLPPTAGLRPGLFGRLLLTLDERRGTVVPAEAVRRVGALDTIRVIQDGAIQTRYVRLGEALPNGTVEILSGLNEGDLVLLPPSSVSVNQTEEAQ